MSENCMLVPAKHCSGVPLINTREKGGGEEEKKGHSFLVSSARRGTSSSDDRKERGKKRKGEKITKSGPYTRAQTHNCCKRKHHGNFLLRPSFFLAGLEEIVDPDCPILRLTSRLGFRFRT